MSVGLVLVSHSSRLAEGLAELAAQMAPDVVILPVGGTADGGLGTDATRVEEAVLAANTGEGVVVFGDLGSALLTADTVLEMLDDDDAAQVRVARGPFVEGAVQAAVAAQTGAGLDAVLVAGAGESTAVAEVVPTLAPDAGHADGELERTVTLVNAEGLHARPAADFVRAVARFDAQITVNGVDGSSLLAIMGLGLVRGAEAVVRASGPEAATALDALSDLIASGFGES